MDDAAYNERTLDGRINEFIRENGDLFVFFYLSEAEDIIVQFPFIAQENRCQIFKTAHIYNRMLLIVFNCFFFVRC